MSSQLSFTVPMTSARLRWVQAAIVVLGLVPFVRLFVLGYANALGANPVEAVTRSTGWWTLALLLLTLTVTPLRRLSGLAWVLRTRRTLGLLTFFYACIHLTTWVWFDKWFDLDAMLADVWKQPHLTAGVAALLLMVPLALTSTAAAMRRLGRRWKQLHKAIYLVAPLGVLHFWLHKAGKNDLFEPAVFLLLLAVLLGWRVVDHHWRRPTARANPAASALSDR